VAIGLEEYLSRARARLRRLAPVEAWAAASHGDLIVDIRSEDQVRAGGTVPGAVWVPRNALEWRAAPGSPHADPAIARCTGRLMLICQEGYQSSLAAATLLDLGRQATDVVGGFAAWVEAGLPAAPPDPHWAPGAVQV
jgi:rhodanese-related sulfurtransferase